jgi:hypothetical protein
VGSPRVDEPNGLNRSERRGSPRGASTLVEYFDQDGRLIFSSIVPAAPGDGSFSFFGILVERLLCVSESQRAMQRRDRMTMRKTTS